MTLCDFEKYRKAYLDYELKKEKARKASKEKYELKKQAKKIIEEITDDEVQFILDNTS